MKALVLGSRTWEMTDKETGEIRSGVKLTYIDPVAEEAGDVRGFHPMALSGPGSMASEVKDIPGIYELDIRMRPGQANRPTLSLVGCSFVQSVNIAEIVNDVPASPRQKS